MKPLTLVMPITSSEPRDVLQSERTALAFIKFACTLLFAALAIMLDFRFESEDKRPLRESWYQAITSFTLMGLALAMLVVCAVNYIVTVQRYASHRVHTYNFNNKATVVCMSTVMVVLMAICSVLIVHGYIREKSA